MKTKTRSEATIIIASSLRSSSFACCYRSTSNSISNNRHEKIGFFADSGELESFECRKNPFRDFKARQVVYKAVKGDDEFLAEYERLICGVIVPRIKTMLVDEGVSSTSVPLFYQYVAKPGEERSDEL